MLNQLQEELKLAMKGGDKATMLGLRNIIGKLKAAQIDKREPLIEDETMKILKSAAKQLKESVEQYNKRLLPVSINWQFNSYIHNDVFSTSYRNLICVSMILN